MSKKNILLAISNGMWLIQPEFVYASSGLIVRILNGLEAFENKEEDDESVRFKSSFSVSVDGAVAFGNKYNPFEGAQPNSTAVIGMSGPIMKYDNCGDPGTKTYAYILNKAKSNPNINSVVIVGDSPGGTVDGTQELAAEVESFPKPLVFYVDGLTASAMYWVASGAKEIIANNETATIGSIGTMISFADMQPKLEKEGAVFHYITADASVDKNRDFLEARKGNYDLVKEKLNAINDIFTTSVMQNRGGKLNLDKENVLTGKTYLAQDALSAGLIDAIESFDYAISRAQALASGEQDILIQKQPTPMTKITLLASQAALLAICGTTLNAGETSAEVELNEELIQKINAQLTELTLQKSSLESSLESSVGILTNKIKTLEENVSAGKLALETADAKIRSLENPGVSNALKTGADKVAEKSTDAEVWEISHNKEALNNPLFQ